MSKRFQAGQAKGGARTAGSADAAIRNSLRVAACAIALAAGASVATPAFAQTAAVAQGPMIGAVTAKSAKVWVRLDAPATVRVRYKTPKAVDYTYSDVATVDADGDFTARFTLAGLAAGKTYSYQVGITTDDVETWSGSYTFSSLRGTVTSLSFAVMADFANKLQGSEALRTALAARPEFLAVIGDLDHRSPAADENHVIHPPEDAPLVLDDLRAMHRDTRDFATEIGNDFASGLIGFADSGVKQIPLYYAWDDHDFCVNNADDTCPFAAQAVQSYREYYLWSDDNGIDGTNGCPIASDFQSVRYGRVATVFMLDARSARDEAADTLLGDCQYNWLKRGLANAKTTWKIILSPGPFNPSAKTWDGWGEFPGERSRLLSFIQRKAIRNVVFISADMHTGGAVDDGTHSGAPEVSVPHANMPENWINTFCKLFDQGNYAQSEPGLWTMGSLVEPDFGNTPATCGGNEIPPETTLVWPDVGVYPLSGLDTPGYVSVDATATTLTATVHAPDGSVRDGVLADGSATPMQLTLTAN